MFSTCSLSNAQQGATPPILKQSLLTQKPMRKKPASHLNYDISKHFPNMVMVSVSIFNSYLTQHDVGFFKKDIKVDHTLELAKILPFRLHHQTSVANKSHGGGYG